MAQFSGQFGSSFPILGAVLEQAGVGGAVFRAVWIQFSNLEATPEQFGVIRAISRAFSIPSQIFRAISEWSGVIGANFQGSSDPVCKLSE